MKFDVVMLPRMALALSVALLSACSVLPEPGTSTVYLLPAATVQAATDASSSRTQPAADWALQIDTPYSSQLINSQRVLVQPMGDAINVYQGVRWGDTAPVMLRDYLVDAFRVQAPRLVVSNDSSRVFYDLALISDLNQFQVVYGTDGPVVHLQLDASLVQASGKRTVASQRFTAQQAVDGTAVPQVVAAFGMAANTLATQVVTWTLQHPPASR
ncbi:membrane integrity-associated transporter subunit PqiC [Alcaligenaceae bacterium]|nr:membrane integrity-associated transporter subunit PqiC [Alcaligenaceae bacterium]